MNFNLRFLLTSLKSKSLFPSHSLRTSHFLFAQSVPGDKWKKEDLLFCDNKAIEHNDQNTIAFDVQQIKKSVIDFVMTKKLKLKKSPRDGYYEVHFSELSSRNLKNVKQINLVPCVGEHPTVVRITTSDNKVFECDLEDVTWLDNWNLES